MDFTKVKLNNVLKAETSRSRSKSCNGRTNNEFYSEIHIPLPSKWTNSVRGDGEKHENSKRKAKQNRENSSKKNYSVELRPGHYQLSVHWPSKPRPVCITLTPEKENGYTPPGEQQPLLYDDVSPPSPSSFPRRVVNKLFPPSTSGAASNARNGSHHPKVGGSASRKRQGGGLENQSRYYQRKGKHRWASLSCIHFANLDDDDAFGGYEGVEHLKRTSLGEVRGSSEGVSGSDLYFINNFASSQCHSLLDVYSTSTSTAHVCKLNKVVKDTDVPEKTFVSHSLDELISYCKEDIKFKRRKEPSLGAIERRTWHEYENFLSRVVDEYFRETVPVSDLENILGSGKMCSKKRSKRSDVYSLRRRSPYERSVWSTPPALNSPEAMKKSLQRSDDINKSSNELNTYSGCNERKMSISDGIYRSSDEENSWYSDESLGYRADTEGSDKETVSEVVVPFKYCENTPNLNYKKRVFKESCKNSKARMYFEWAKETRQMNMERRYAVSVDSLLNYNPFTKFPDFNTATLPNLIFNLKNNNNNKNNKDFNPKNAYNGYDEIEKYTEMLDEKKREIVEHLLCDFAKSTSSYSEDFPGLANKSNSFIERGYCASGKNEMTASPSSLCDIDKILNKGLVINHSEGKVPSETISLYSSPSAEENNNNNNNSFDENSLYLEENFPQLNEESKVLLTDGFPITRNIVIISEDENFVKKRESRHLSEIDINDKNSLHSYTSKSWSTLGVNKLGRCHNEDNSIYLKPLDFKSDLCYKANICNELKKPSDFSADLISLESVCDPIWPRNCGSLRERMSSCRSRHLEFAPSHTLGDEARVGPDRKVSKVTQDALLGKPLITEASLPTPEVSHPHLRASRSSPRAQGASLVQLLPSLENRDRVCECSMGSVQSGEGRKSCDVEDSLRDWEKAGKNVNPRRPKSRKYFSEIFENFGSSRTPNKRENFPAYSSYGGARSSSSFASPTSNFVKDSDVGSNRANPSFVKCNTNNDKEKLSISVVPNSSQPNSSCQGSKLWKTANDQPNSSERFKKQEVKCEKSELRSHSYVNDDHNFLSKESSFRVYPTHGERAFRNVSDVDRNPVEKLRSSSHLYENTYFHEHRYVGEFSYINSLIESCASEEEGLSPSTDCRSSPSRDSTPATSSSEVTDRGEEFSQKSDPPPDTLAKKTPPINLPEEEEEEEEDDPMSADEETSESSSGKFSVCRSESSESVASDASSFYYTAGGSELYDAVEEVTKYFSFIDKIDSEQSSNRPTERDETPTKMTPGASKDDDGGGDGNNDSDDDDDDDDDNNNDNDDDNNDDDDDNDDDNNDDDDDDGDTEATALIDSENNTPTSSPSEEPFTSFFDLKKSNSYSFSSHEYVNANVVVKDSQILVTIKPGVENFPPDHLNDDTNNEDCNPIYENSSPSANAERNEKSPCKSKHSDDGLVYASPCVTHSDSENEIKVFDTKAFPDDVNLPETDQTQQHREKDEVHFDIGVRIPQLRECLSEGDIKLSDKDYDFDDESSLYAPLTVSEEESEGLRTSVDDVSSLPERYSDTSHSSSSPEPACEGHQNQYPIPRFPSEARPVIHVGLEDPHRQCASNVVWNRLDLNPEGSFIAFDTSTVSPITNCFPFGFSPPVSPVDAKKPPPFPHRGRESSSLPREGQSQSQMRRRCRSVSSADTASRRRNRRRVVSMIKTSQESLHDHWFCPGDRAPDTRWVAERKKAEGNEFYKSKQYREAIKLYSDAIELCPECASYYSNRSACHMMLGKFTQALADAREAVRLDASFVKGYIRVAKCNIALGDPNAALSILRQATELEPGNKTVRDEVTNANALIRCGDEVEKATMKKDYRTAIYYLDRALDLAAGCRSLKITKAEYLVYLHRHGEAQEIVNEILQFDSGNVDAIYVRGLCLYYQDNQEAAFTHFQHVLKLAPDHKKAKESYKKAKVLKVKKEEGNQAFNKGNFREALNLYTEALAIDVNNKTTNSKLYSNRATAKAKLGKLDEAVDDCTAAINLNEGYVKAYLRRAKCYQDLEKHEDAVRDYEKVCKLDKNQEHKRLLHDANEQLKCSKRKDYYKILGVSRNATEDDIKKSYKKMALQHHPDRHANASDKEKQEHEIKFKEIGEAYAVLTDPKKRSMYDRGQDINDPDCGLGHGGVDPNQIFQAFFSSGGANFSFGHHGGFSQSSFGGGGGGGGGFPGGLHFQFG